MDSYGINIPCFCTFYILSGRLWNSPADDIPGKSPDHNIDTKGKAQLPLSFQAVEEINP